MYIYTSGSSYSAGLNPKVGVNLVPQKVFLELPSFPVSVVWTRQKVATSGNGYRISESVPHGVKAPFVAVDETVAVCLISCVSDQEDVSVALG